MTAHTYASPITRPTYVEIGDVPRPSVACTALIRHTEWTTIRIHPGAYTPQVVQEIVQDHRIRHEEATVWLGGFRFPSDPASISEFLRDPVGFLYSLGPDAVGIPCLATSIPVPLQVPGLRYA